MSNQKILDAEQTEALLALLNKRFDKHMQRHKHLIWKEVEQALRKNPEKLWSLNEMERTGGEPDVLADGEVSDHYSFYDCAAESPKGRRSLCYDRAALDSRKDHPPENTVLDVVAELGIELLTEEQYRLLQSFGPFDLKTSSWVQTPVDIRELDGAIFCDYRYGRVFTYHNGAQSYYASRGFRGLIHI